MNTLKNRWLGRVARVALERLADGREGFERLPWKGLRRGLKGLRAGKRQA